VLRLAEVFLEAPAFELGAPAFEEDDGLDTLDVFLDAEAGSA